MKASSERIEEVLITPSDEKVFNNEIEHSSNYAYQFNLKMFLSRIQIVINLF